MSQPACTCDNAGAEFPHQSWRATEHQHPSPDCTGLCEPVERVAREYRYLLTYADGTKKFRPADSLTIARAVADSPANWNPPGQPGEVYEREVRVVYGPWRLVPAEGSSRD